MLLKKRPGCSERIIRAIHLFGVILQEVFLQIKAWTWQGERKELTRSQKDSPTGENRPGKGPGTRKLLGVSEKLIGVLFGWSQEESMRQSSRKPEARSHGACRLLWMVLRRGVKWFYLHFTKITVWWRDKRKNRSHETIYETMMMKKWWQLALHWVQ